MTCSKFDNVGPKVFQPTLPKYQVITTQPSIKTMQSKNIKLIFKTKKQMKSTFVCIMCRFCLLNKREDDAANLSIAVKLHNYKGLWQNYRNTKSGMKWTLICMLANFPKSVLKLLYWLFFQNGAEIIYITILQCLLS